MRFVYVKEKDEVAYESEGGVFSLMCEEESLESVRKGLHVVKEEERERERGRERRRERKRKEATNGKQGER